MSILFKARGSQSFGIFLLRLSLGTYTLVMGIIQANKMEAYIDKVKNFGILSENLSFIVGFILPFILIVFGGLYIMGFFMPVTSFVLALVTLLKVFARGFIVSEGIPFNKDLIFFFCFLLTLFSGAGLISFDAFLDRKKKTAATEKQVKVTAEVVTEKTGTEKQPTDGTKTSGT